MRWLSRLVNIARELCQAKDPCWVYWPYRQITKFGPPIRDTRFWRITGKHLLPLFHAWVEEGEGHLRKTHDYLTSPRNFFYKSVPPDWQVSSTWVGGVRLGVKQYVPSSPYTLEMIKEFSCVDNIRKSRWELLKF